MPQRLSAINRFTAELCHERARECLALTLETGSQPARHILEHIAECWSDIAAELTERGATERSRAQGSASAQVARQ